MNAYDDIAPPDKADSSPILQAAYELCAAVARRTRGGKAEVTVLLGEAEWAALEAETRRQYRPHASEKYAPHPGGAGAVRFRRVDVSDYTVRAKPLTAANVFVSGAGSAAGPCKHAGAIESETTRTTSEEAKAAREPWTGPPPIPAIATKPPAPAVDLFAPASTEPAVYGGPWVAPEDS